MKFRIAGFCVILYVQISFKNASCCPKCSIQVTYSLKDLTYDSTSIKAGNRHELKHELFVQIFISTLSASNEYSNYYLRKVKFYKYKWALILSRLHTNPLRYLNLHCLLFIYII